MNRIITIGREFGSGGREMGRRLAEELGIAYYDQEIISEISRRTELSEQYVKKMAEKSDCVIVGRCADYVLRNQSDVDALNLFIHAPMEERIRRVREEYKVQAPDLRLYILKQDKNRAAYYEHFTDGQWGKAQNYHLAVSSGLGLETIVRLLTDLMRDRGLGA